MKAILTQLTFLGLLADIAGAIFISKSVFFKSNKEIFGTSAGAWGYSRERSLDGIVAKREALFGCLMILLGFTGQFVGALHKNETISWPIIIVAGAIITGFSLLVSFLIKQWSVRTVEAFIVAYTEEKEADEITGTPLVANPSKDDIRTLQKRLDDMIINLYSSIKRR